MTEQQRKYREYLATPRWQDIALTMKRRAKWTCADCAVRYNYLHRGALNVHHLNYRCLGRETTLDLVVLCENCHARRESRPIRARRRLSPAQTIRQVLARVMEFIIRRKEAA
jgi:5-methylcytosine-specific restriction endonuclease McrA